MEDKSQRTSVGRDYELDWESLERATNNFSEERVVGSSLWGVVYKGILEDGQEIAVKKFGHENPLNPIHSYLIGNNAIFQPEYIQHQNIVRLVGSCYVYETEHEEYALVRLKEIAICSEYVQGGSLDKHVSDESCGLHWHLRYKIIKGICEGLNYLHNGHEPPIYCGRLKLRNILLDRNMVPKIGNFALSDIRHRYKFLLQSDIFNLGSIIIQIMAGADARSKYAEMPPQEFVKLVHENWRKRFRTAMLFPITSHQVRTCIKIALRCVKRNPMERPTINKIVNELNKIDTSLMGRVYRTREFTFGNLDRITNHFHSEHELGSGGYGVVYKGILDDGEEIAVKKLRSMPWLDDHQFNNELNNLMGIEHPNIVRLVGYCHHTSLVTAEYKGKIVRATEEERALCFEYLEEGSLDKHLSDESCEFDWHTSYKIIRGICEGLHYLQKGSKHPIYHLDLKPANIVLDKDMLPKIGDFGLARLFDSIQTYLTQSQNTMGTRGYMPPEYIDGQQISPKFDIFSLGVIIIQIMTGKEGSCNYATMPSKEFVKLVQEKWRKKMPEIMSPHTLKEVKTCIGIALRCVETNREKRLTITEIINELNILELSKVHL